MTERILVSSEADDRVGVELLSQIDGAEVVTYDPNAELFTAAQAEASILLPPYRGSHRPRRLLPQLPRLQMVQLLSAGADEYAGHVPRHVTLTTARGAHTAPVSEWIMSAILAIFRQWPAFVRYQDRSVWAHRRVDQDTLAGKKVLIVGAGHIGTATARKLAAFDATPTLVASTARTGVHSPDELHGLVGNHDIIVITAPLTEQTRGLVDAEFLRRMKTGALLVNAGRGQIVDTGALLVELQNERLRAALDVTDPEPLPNHHPLWRCPGVIISPHSARTVPGTNVLCYEVAKEQITTWLTGAIPTNNVAR